MIELYISKLIYLTNKPFVNWKNFKCNHYREFNEATTYNININNKYFITFAGGWEDEVDKESAHNDEKGDARANVLGG